MGIGLCIKTEVPAADAARGLRAEGFIPSTELRNWYNQMTWVKLLRPICSAAYPRAEPKGSKVFVTA